TFPRAEIENGRKVVFASAARTQRRMGTSGAISSPKPSLFSPDLSARARRLQLRPLNPANKKDRTRSALRYLHIVQFLVALFGGDHRIGDRAIGRFVKHAERMHVDLEDRFLFL